MLCFYWLTYVTLFSYRNWYNLLAAYWFSLSISLSPLTLSVPLSCHTNPLQSPFHPKIKTYNFYLVIEVPDHVYVFYAYRLYFADKDIYIIRYLYHKIEIIRVIASTDIFCSASLPHSAPTHVDK